MPNIRCSEILACRLLYETSYCAVPHLRNWIAEESHYDIEEMATTETAEFLDISEGARNSTLHFRSDN
jgi:hypothetical protein